METKKAWDFSKVLQHWNSEPLCYSLLFAASYVLQGQVRILLSITTRTDLSKSPLLNTRILP